LSSNGYFKKPVEINRGIGFNIWQNLAGSNPHAPICSDGPVEVI